jgi:hypothetical protein
MDDVRPRAPVTLRPIFTYLMIFDALLGFLTWLFLFLILNLSGVPEIGPADQPAGRRGGRARPVAAELHPVHRR